MKVVIAELIWPIGIEKLKEVADVEYDPDLWKNRELLLMKMQEADALVVRNQTKVDEELLRSANKLKVVGRLGVGLDNIDLQAAKLLDVKVVYARNANATSVAEYVMAAMLETSRSLLTASWDVRAGNWNRQRFTGAELSGKTVGLLGMGEIAHRVAKRALAFGMQVIGYDPFVAPYDFVATETGVRPVSFPELLAESDFLSIHVPLTPQTKAMISADQLQHMKREAYLINTSRGGILDEAALLDAVMQKQIAGAFLDVLEEEPVDPQHPLLQCENIYITPHIAGLTEESQIRTSRLVAEEVGRVLRQEEALCIVR